MHTCRLRTLSINLALLSFFFSVVLSAQVNYRVDENEPNAWHWMASASLHTQNFNSANLRFEAQLKPVDWFVVSADAYVPLYATAFSGDKNSGYTMMAHATGTLRWGSVYRDKERVNISSSSSTYGNTRTTSTSYFEPELKVYSYAGLRGGLGLEKTAQPVNASRFDIVNTTGTQRISDTTWNGETRVSAVCLHAGIEWGRDSHANISYESEGSSGTLHPCYSAKYFLDFLYLPSISYDNFKAANAEYVVNKRSSQSYTQMGGRLGFEQNFRWWCWGAELGLHRRFGPGESSKLSENGYGYLSMYFGFNIGDFAPAH